MVNGGFTSFTGIAAADAVGRPLQEVMAWPLDPKRTKRSRFARKLRDPAGRERLVAVTATPATDAAGAVSSIVLLGVDDTERREAEQGLYNAERFATVGEMAATMAHEISQPLQVINIACASALDKLAIAAEQRGGPELEFVQARLERIGTQVDQASRIIGDLRAYVRGTASEMPEPFDPGEALLVDFRRLRMVADNRGDHARMSRPQAPQVQVADQVAVNFETLLDFRRQRPVRHHIEQRRSR